MKRIGCVAIVFTLGAGFCLLVSAVLNAREAARRMSCSCVHKQFALALHNYHAVYNQLPPLRGGTDGGSERQSNQGRLSGHVPLVPFMEHQELWEDIMNMDRTVANDFPPMGPAPWIADFTPWTWDNPYLRCPSDPNRGKTFGRVNSVFCIGTIIADCNDPAEPSGVFGGNHVATFDQITDGLANTILTGEVATGSNNGDPRQHWIVNAKIDLVRDPRWRAEQTATTWTGARRSDSVVSSLSRGGRWADGAVALSAFQTVLPPLSINASFGGGVTDDGIFNAGSYHVGGAHVAMADGAVRFIIETIDCGPGDPSNQDFGVWGDLGTAHGESTETP